MIELEEGNVLPYLAEHYPEFDQSGPVRVHYIGDADDAPDPCTAQDCPIDPHTAEQPAEDQESGGLINFIFRVSNGERSVIVKQARARSRANADLVIPTSRNRQEYESLKLRAAVVPEYVPEVYFADLDNATFVMEDVSYLKQARTQLIAGRTFPHLAEQVGRYVAANSFYFSEFFLDPDEFRRLAGHFRNSDMRSIMESWVFLRDAPYLHHHGNAALKRLIDSDTALNARCYELRHKFMTHAEALIHGDLHTSNMFVDDDHLKVIDMEYTFAGPLCYDIGYFSGSLLTQWCAGLFREDFASEAEKQTFLDYLLDTLVGTYEAFTSHFIEYWKRDAKPVYRDADAFLRELVCGFLPDVLGFMAVPCLPAITTNPMPECLALSEEGRTHAEEICLVVCRYLLVEGSRFTSMREAADAIREMGRIFLAAL